MELKLVSIGCVLLIVNLRIVYNRIISPCRLSKERIDKMFTYYPAYDIGISRKLFSKEFP